MGLHFIMAGRELVEPIPMEDALTRAIFKRPCADIDIFQDAAGNQHVRLPWRSEEEARQKLTEHLVATKAIHRMLCEDRLRAYVQNPSSGAYMRLPRLYWKDHPIGGPYDMPKVEASGWDDSMEGQPILVAAEDLPQWEAAADQAVGAAPSPAQPTARAEKPSSRGRPDKKADSLAIFAERARGGETKQDRQEEARIIVARWGKADPPKQETVAGYIKDFHPLGRWDERGKLLNGPELAALARPDLIEKRDG